MTPCCVRIVRSFMHAALRLIGVKGGTIMILLSESMSECCCADPAIKKVKDFSRRTSSGNWINDRVTWKEELNYKKAMGYI